MIKKLLSLISTKEASSNTNSEGSIKLAAVSLLIQVAKADHELTQQEESQLIQLVETNFENADSNKNLIELAKANSEASTSLYEFTSIINENYSELEKFNLITMMWQIAFSDQVIHAYEEHLIRRVADLIYLPHVKFIEAKHNAQEKI